MVRLKRELVRFFMLEPVRFGDRLPYGVAPLPLVVGVVGLVISFVWPLVGVSLAAAGVAGTAVFVWRAVRSDIGGSPWR